MIKFKEVVFAYDKNGTVLDGINFELKQGLTLLLGPNGCGKSTLMKLAAGVEKPDSGIITIDGHNLWEEEVAAREFLAYLPEQPDLTPYASVKEIIDLVCRLRHQPLAAGEEALEFFGITQQAGRTVRELSMGQRRRAVFAACWIGSPRYIVLDEPLEGMDISIQSEIMKWIQNRTASGVHMLVVSHFLDPFVDIASQAATLKDGLAFLFADLPDTSADRQRLLKKLAQGKELPSGNF